ncbi:hypothetical protein DEO72_LG5g1962 [Vigna unguiculata]|uniref:Uncharacterized protein n=1 Tax=Vigna unguiculata TaxID=3917 RepID=A0A4D6M116_VIGUN|nr:hypothetical protein DEO72_LG5g1962 [Vigna unguiculata]
MRFALLGNSYETEKTWNAWRLAVEIVPPSDTYGQGHQGRLALGGMCPLPGDLEACCAWQLRSSARRYCRGRNYVLLALDVCGLQGFDDISKAGLLVFLKLWFRTYLLSCGSG